MARCAGGFHIGEPMDDKFQHFAAHPYFLMGVKHERAVVIELIHSTHKEEHILTPSHVCRSCRIIMLIDGTE